MWNDYFFAIEFRKRGLSDVGAGVVFVRDRLPDRLLISVFCTAVMAFFVFIGFMVLSLTPAEFNFQEDLTPWLVPLVRYLIIAAIGLSTLAALWAAAKFFGVFFTAAEVVYYAGSPKRGLYFMKWKVDRLRREPRYFEGPPEPPE